MREAHLFAWRNPSGVDPWCWCSADECESGGFKCCFHSDAWQYFNVVISSYEKMVLYESVVGCCGKLKHLDGILYKTYKTNQTPTHTFTWDLLLTLLQKSSSSRTIKAKLSVLLRSRIHLCHPESLITHLQHNDDDYGSTTPWDTRPMCGCARECANFTPPSLSLLSAWWSPFASMLGRTMKWHGWCSCSLSPAGSGQARYCLPPGFDMHLFASPGPLGSDAQQIIPTSQFTHC